MIFHPALRVAILTWIGFYSPALVQAQTCYNADGSVHEESTTWNQTACNPSAAISPCCDQADYCLSNGLCFGQGANNLLSFQGCTDAKWGSPCFSSCNSVSGLGNVNYIFPCPQADSNTDGLTYCCQSDPDPTSCCKNGGSFTVPKGDVILRPGQSYISTSTSSAVPGPTTSATSPQPSTAETSQKTLAIGLGVGIPLGLILIGSLLFAASQLRRFNKAREIRYNNPSIMQAQDTGTTRWQMEKAELQGADRVRPVAELNA